ncbi:hypothetical protein H0E87_001215 [Populus deltoides]|uniref:Uncharacterized protein n=1 Tax=Populus deltoides TaxID=3696 RepID=A0A8T2ZQI2_POPDE|nr:hypothetical protein H0E87_001215 [Populus deltoides]
MPKFAGLKQSIFVGKIAICIFNSSHAVNYETKTQQASVRLPTSTGMKRLGYYVAVKLTLLIYNFVFIVGSTGAIKASQLVLNAIEILKQKLGAVRLSDDIVEADDQFDELSARS